ncbi:uncharacterized protein LOC123442050 [Hordeum vulgare subsp. vulgare]|uniref:uncharacterized protein LOC123442050 n=1 Tax=Hordeum vulgare subsp. vulgare TaxID=112509 RepID=UPI001D1A33F9|nr:uncharacterized protein LOC123442050 [Hordeum vulgare subsp. vulgare]
MGGGRKDAGGAAGATKEAGCDDGSYEGGAGGRNFPSRATNCRLDVISKPDSLPEIPPAKAPNTAVRPWTAAAAAAAGGASGPDEPCDARVVRELLRSTGLGEGEGEPRVVHQFLDLAYRYVGDVLGDAQVYADHAAKPQLDADDVRLAIQARVNFSFFQPPPREDEQFMANGKRKQEPV